MAGQPITIQEIRAVTNNMDNIYPALDRLLDAYQEGDILTIEMKEEKGMKYIQVLGQGCTGFSYVFTARNLRG